MSAARLAQLRATASLVILLAGLLAVRRWDLLRVDRADIPRLAFFGLALALNHATYFLAIHKLKIGVALTIEYLAPLLVLAWLRIGHGRRLPRGVWAAAGASVLGCLLVLRAYDPGAIPAAGVAAALAAAVAYAAYIFTSERVGRSYAPATTVAWGFAFASLFWAVIEPPWDFPYHAFSSARGLSLGLYVVVLGTLVPFACIFAAVRHVPASRAAVVATLEPVLAAALAWPIQGQALAPVQILGSLVVVGAIVWVQARAPAPQAEIAPAYGARRRPSAG
ncbi:MAG: hypothetical protein QOK31_902 [Solirubrobacteraceae bacterium]|nr:hypothetical protein [Solirubrobacteraceae bacterium]